MDILFKEGYPMDEEIKKKLPGLFLLSFSTFVVCAPAAFTQVISFDLMLDLNSFPGSEYAWAFPAFVAGECASMGLCAGILDRVGRKKPFLFGSLLFIVFTVACALCKDMLIFDIFRLFQGFGAGIIIVTCIAQIFFDVKDPKGRYIANGIMSLGFGVGMLFGVFAGKEFIQTIGWPIAFWAFAILQCIILYPCLEVLSNGEKSEKKADVLGGVILIFLAGSVVLYMEMLYLEWEITDVEGIMGAMLIAMLFLAFLVAEFMHPNSMFHRKMDNGRLFTVSMVFILLLGVIDMGAVGYMVKIALFTYQMSVLEAAPYFVVLVLGAATTAIILSKTIHKTGHMPWLLLTTALSPVALLSMKMVSKDDPSFMFALHLFLLGLGIGCLVSMLNATIQNRATKDNNGALMSFAIMARTIALWLGYNIYQAITDGFMTDHLGETIAHWNEIMPLELPSNSSLANLLVTPLADFIKIIPGLTDEIATVFADGVGYAFTFTAIAFVAIALPFSLLLFRRPKTL